MRTISPWELGGTLFVPATHKHLKSIASGNKFPALRSMVIDTEDGINESELNTALQQIAALLPQLQPAPLLRFLRPRNADVLADFLAIEEINRIDGFVLPKFGKENAKRYLSLLDQTPFLFMPSIEGKELFDPLSLAQLRDHLAPYQNRIPLIRFGAEDMLRQLGLRRNCSRSLFDMAAPAYTIGALLSTFKPYGFEIGGAVFRCYADQEGFKKDVLRDLAEGLISKTIIHPNQIEMIDECYRVSPHEVDEARQLLNSEDAVFSLNGTMGEVSTQKKWAYSIQKRAQFFGQCSL